MSSTLPSFILGYHGCDRSVAEAIFSGSSAHLISSQNEYDRLGHGIYFWENSPQRALNYVREQMWRTTRKRKIHEKQEEVIAAAALPRDGRNEISSPQTLYPRPRRVCISPQGGIRVSYPSKEFRARSISRRCFAIIRLRVGDATCSQCFKNCSSEARVDLKNFDGSILSPSSAARTRKNFPTSRNTSSSSASKGRSKLAFRCRISASKARACRIFAKSGHNLLHANARTTHRDSFLKALP